MEQDTEMRAINACFGIQLVAGLDVPHIVKKIRKRARIG